MNSLKPRLLTAVVGISLLILVIFVGEMWSPSMQILVGIASAFMVGEYLNAKKLLKILPLSLPCMAFSAVLPFLIATNYLYIALFLFMIMAFAVMIGMHTKISYADIAFAVTGTLLISFGMSCLSTVCSLGSSFAFFFVAAFALPWMADAGGFFIGASMGKHKLCPNISPKKTVEGAIGGVIFCVISAVIVGLIFENFILSNAKINYLALIILAVIDAPISILGDLSFSLIKRNLNIKDYGSIFPGHGGVLDRFDSIIFTAPVVLILNQYIPFITLG